MQIFNKLFHRDKKMVVRVSALVFLDIMLIIISMVGALWIRLDFRFANIDPTFLETIWEYMFINIVCTLIIYKIMHLYSSLWRYASVMEVENVIVSTILSTAFQAIGMKILGLHIPRSYPLLYLFLLTGMTLLVRFSYRLARRGKNGNLQMKGEKTVRTMIVGAGAAGDMLVREMKNSQYLSRVIPCIVDDDPRKQGTYLQGIKIVGGTEKIPQLAEKYQIEEIVIAIPTLSPQNKKQLLDICQEASCKIMTLPGIYQLVNKEVSVSMLREVDINDLLGRAPVQLEMEQVMDYVKGKVILVTGGGGSIGSEICRQIALHHPKQLIIFDIYENNAYDIRNELLRNHPELNLEVLIGSVRDKKRVDTIFEVYCPEIIFHAAAHKHVPLMEDSPNESIKNNVLGTYIVAYAADAYHAKKMVLISTDKAVRPTNIMGASKRICELIIQSFAQTSKTEFAAVRFGNVLGSNGSVVPLFRKQIAEGGPVTVTHPDIIRYFMTIPEAVNLVLQCGALAKGGEIFILDMGEPVKILDLAVKMIRLSGLTPNKDIKIEFTGLRPGEKLYEELLLSLDNLRKTANERIFVAQQPKVDEKWVQEQVQKLIENAFDEATDIREQVKELVPEYQPRSNEEVNKQVALTKDK